MSNSLINTLRRKSKTLWIDFYIQRKSLRGTVASLDGNKMMYDTASTSYDMIKIIFFNYFKLADRDIIVDVGCGKGRVFNYLLYRGLTNKMIGYEINEMVANELKQNLSRYKNVEILSENIFENFPTHANVFYMFNPFKEGMMQDFKECIWKMKDNNPVILYYNPTCLNVFDDNRFVYDIKTISGIMNDSKQAGWHYDKLAIIRIKPVNS